MSRTLSDVEYLILARAIAEKKFAKGLFSASTISVSSQWKKKVNLWLQRCLSRGFVQYKIAVQLDSSCPKALLRKLKLLDLVESAISGENHAASNPGSSLASIQQVPLGNTRARPPSPMVRQPHRPPSAPPDNSSSSPSPPPTPPLPPSPAVSPIPEEDFPLDISRGLLKREIKPQRMLAHWTLKHKVSRRSLTALLKYCKGHCPVIDFRRFPKTAETLLKVRICCGIIKFCNFITFLFLL